LRMLRACVYCTMFCFKKNSICAGFSILSMAIKKSNGLHFLRNCSKFWRARDRMNLIML
jgi:hypothetical protein